MWGGVTVALFPRKIVAAILAALATSAAAMAGTVLFYYSAFVLANSTAGVAVMPQVLRLFAWPSAIVFVIVALLGAAGAYSRWYFRLVTGIVASVVGVVLGTLPQVQGALTPAVFASILQSLLSLNLLFIVAVTVATLTLGACVFRRALDWAPASARHTLLVRPPSSNLAEGQLTHIDRVPADLELADRQWDAYVAAMTAEGWEVVEVPLGQGLADSVFVEDAVVMFGPVAVLTSPGAESRQAEIAAVERTVRELGLRVERIVAPGTLDGGDVLKVGTTVYVGRGGRTNAEGIRQLRAIVAPLGYTVVAVPVSKALHLKSAVTALPDGTVIGHPSVVDDPSVFGRFLPMPEHGSAVVVLGPDAVLMAASVPQSAALIAGLGYRVVTVDVSEFEKLEGCVTCLSVRVR